MLQLAVIIVYLVIVSCLLVYRKWGLSLLLTIVALFILAYYDPNTVLDRVINASSFQIEKIDKKVYISYKHLDRSDIKNIRVKKLEKNYIEFDYLTQKFRYTLLEEEYKNWKLLLDTGVVQWKN